MLRSVPQTPDATTPQSISDWDRQVLDRYWDYDFQDTGFAWPSQALVAHDLGRSRYSVHRSVKRLCTQGHMRLHTKRKGRKWLHNVYELCEPGKPRFKAAANRILQRAIQRRLRISKRRALGLVHTNHGVVYSTVGFSGLQRLRMSEVVLR